MSSAASRSAVVLVTVFLAGCVHPAGKALGASDGKLTPCPSAPNCVSSQALASDSKHFIAPIAFSGDAADEMQRVKRVLQAMPRTKVVADRPDYLRVEFRSRLWRFVDDLEIVSDESRQVLDVRSGARVGHSDFGVNRERVESIRAQLAAIGSAP